MAAAMALCSATTAQTLTSPNKVLSLKTQAGNCTIYYKGTPIGQFGNLGMKTKQCAEIKTDASFALSKGTKVGTQYTMLTGKKRLCNNVAREAVLASRQHPDMKIRFRVYNDGIAFRYELSGLHNDSIEDDLAEYHVTEGANRFMGKYSQSYEEYFPLEKHVQPEGSYGYPALFQTRQDDIYTLVTEADMERSQSGSYLQVQRGNSSPEGTYAIQLAKNPLTIHGEWHSPWRTMIIGSLGDIVSSTLVNDLAKPCQLNDTTWIKPGMVSWPYWAYNHGSKDYKVVCRYIDMAEKLHLPYVLIDAEWDEMSNGGNIHDAIAYAKKKGVKLMIWYNSSTGWLDGSPGPHYRLNDPDKREKEFQWLEDEGIVGIKIDFFDGDTQPTMDYCIALLECAARHRLLINFHGATIPRGWQRTYPHLMSTEGVLGAEWYNNNGKLTSRAARHNTTLPFIRNVVGSMDYTPCAFSDSQHPHITTDAHELALTVLFESGLQHLADKPESFYAQPQQVQQFLGALPTTWDETRLLSGFPGDYVVLARRKGSAWYVAGINGNDEPRTVDIPLNDIKKATRQASTYDDAPEGRGWQCASRSTSELPLQLTLRARGGFVWVLTP